MKRKYLIPQAVTIAIEPLAILCQSGGIESFSGPSDPDNVDDPYNYKW